MNKNLDEYHKMKEDQNKRRAAATGFRDDTTDKRS